jgi:mono/diheme cytochrome c family protein
MTVIRDRRFRHASSAMLFPAILAIAAAAQAQTGSAADSSGDYLFRTYCASCHGLSARGDGPLAESMRRRPADLTGIAQRNNGVFPAAQVHRIIDGRQGVKGHGGPDMPVWGDVFSRSSLVRNEAVITARIQALVRYLDGLQARNGY